MIVIASAMHTVLTAYPVHIATMFGRMCEKLYLKVPVTVDALVRRFQTVIPARE
jgi:hypothetical protein